MSDRYACQGNVIGCSNLRCLLAVCGKAGCASVNGSWGCENGSGQSSTAADVIVVFDGGLCVRFGRGEEFMWALTELRLVFFPSVDC